MHEAAEKQLSLNEYISELENENGRLRNQVSDQQQRIETLERWTEVGEQLQQAQTENLQLRRELDVLKLERKEFDARLQRSVEQAIETTKKESARYEPAYVDGIIKSLSQERKKSKELEEKIADLKAEAEKHRRRANELAQQNNQRNLDLKNQADRINFLEQNLSGTKLQM